MKSGKLDSRMLEEIVFRHFTTRRAEVKERPGTGKDCAVIDFGEYDCVLSTDPVTAAEEQLGRLAIHVSCNDIATNGVAPLGIMLACMFPEGTELSTIDRVMADAGQAAAELNVEIVGGHTEITAAVSRPVIVSTALGRIEKGAFPVKEPIRSGDLVLMTKTAGLEGTAILAGDFADRLQDVLTEGELEEAQAMLSRVSVVAEGVAAGQVGTSGMHDITEGGVLGAVWEMCEVAGSGVLIDAAKVPIAPVTEKICRHFDIDGLKLISSGCMLIIANPDKAPAIIRDVRRAGVEIAQIGEIRPSGEGRVLLRDGRSEIIETPGSDELYKVVFSEPAV